MTSSTPPVALGAIPGPNRNPCGRVREKPPFRLASFAVGNSLENQRHLPSRARERAGAGPFFHGPESKRAGEKRQARNYRHRNSFPARVGRSVTYSTATVRDRSRKANDPFTVAVLFSFEHVSLDCGILLGAFETLARPFETVSGAPRKPLVRFLLPSIQTSGL